MIEGVAEERGDEGRRWGSYRVTGVAQAWTRPHVDGKKLALGHDHPRQPAAIALVSEQPPLRPQQEIRKKSSDPLSGIFSGVMPHKHKRKQDQDGEYDRRPRLAGNRLICKAVMICLPHR